MTESLARKNAHIVWGVAAVLFILVAAVAGYKIWPILHPDIAAAAPLDPDCDLRAGPCSTRFADGGQVSFSIAPKDIPVVKPLQFEVQVEGISARQVEVDFQGVDMNMGYNRPRLKQSEQGQFVGQGMLPVCVRYAMEWEAKVLVHTDAGLLAAPFRFITVTQGMTAPDK